MQKQPYWYHEDDEEEQLSHVQNQLHPQHSLRGDEEEGDEGWDEKNARPPDFLLPRDPNPTATTLASPSRHLAALARRSLARSRLSTSS